MNKNRDSKDSKGSKAIKFFKFHSSEMSPVDDLLTDAMNIHINYIQQLLDKKSSQLKVVWLANIAPLHRFISSTNYHSRALGAFVFFKTNFSPEYYVYICADYKYLLFDCKSNLYKHGEDEIYQILAHNPDCICDDYLLYKNRDTVYGFRNGQAFTTQNPPKIALNCNKRIFIIEIMEAWVQSCFPEFRQVQRNEIYKFEIIKTVYEKYKN